MPATYQWFDDSKTIMIEEFSGQWTWNDFTDCIKGATDLIREVDHDVIAIADYTETKMMPVSGASLKIARDVMNYAPDNWRGVIIVTNNRLIRSMVSLFQNANRTFGDKVYLEPTRDDAVRLAIEVLAVLPE